MKTQVETPQSRVALGFARADVTPPVGIYYRMWGAAVHDRAVGVHRPLTATAVWLESGDAAVRQVVVGLDHCLLDPEDFLRIRKQVGDAVGLPVDAVFVAMSHTHGSAWLSRTRSHLPGGDLIGPYLDSLAQTSARCAQEAKRIAEPATLLYGFGRCSLAAHRDVYDPVSRTFVCGFDPDGPADDTVLTAKAVAGDGRTLGTMVNYACHPTTLAWQNALISPDYVGAMREVVESHTKVPCLFLQGASGDLGPREGFVGDPAVADRNGRQLGFAALSAIETLPAPGTTFAYVGPVVSGATLGTWEHRPATREFGVGRTRTLRVPLPYRLELPTETATRAELAHWEAALQQARERQDAPRISECRARCERMTRQLARLAALQPGPSYELAVALTRLGDAVWIFSPGELYQHFQVALRRRFPDHPLVVSTVTNDWQPGYLPLASSYGYGIYQETIAALAPGCLETLTESVGRALEDLLGARDVSL